MNLNKFLRFSPEVAKAMSKGSLRSKIVLLESAILTHGMPYPENYKMALSVQDIIRNEGAIPATIGILKGIVQVGMSNQEIETLCKLSPNDKLKVSRRDFPKVITDKLCGGTTVSGTLAVAGMRPDFSFPLFVTGGIGGVHRGGEVTMDVSADLVEMGRSPTAVISAGVKSILDIGKTLEHLETQGVFVVTLGPDTEFPAFFSRSSGFQSPHNVENVSQASELVRNHLNVGLKSGMLIAVPIPEDAAADGSIIEDAIQSALTKADEMNICGRNVTPFVLDEVRNLTQGLSLKANLSLIKNNAKIGSQIVHELALEAPDQNYHHLGKFQTKTPLVIGGSNVDIITSIAQVSNAEDQGSTQKGTIRMCYGGVGRNIADAMARLEMDPRFISAIGNDNLGKGMKDQNTKLKCEDVFILENYPTATYNLFTSEDGEVTIGIGDMTIHSKIDPQLIKQKISLFQNASLVVMDGNLTEDTLDFCLHLCHDLKIPAFFEPTDVQKASKVKKSKYFNAITYCSPNIYELQTLSSKRFLASDLAFEQIIQESVKCCESLLDVIQVLIVTLGKNGVLIARQGSPDDPLPMENGSKLEKSYKHYPVPKVLDAVCVSGAGDCFVAAFMRAAIQGHHQDQCVSAGFQAAVVSLNNVEAVPAHLLPENINFNLHAQGSLIYI